MKISILKKYIDCQEPIHISIYKNITFEETDWFSEMFKVIKISILKKYTDCHKCIPGKVIKLSILKKYGTSSVDRKQPFSCKVYIRYICF